MTFVLPEPVEVQMSRVLRWHWTSAIVASMGPGWMGFYSADLDCGCRVEVTNEEKESGLLAFPCQGDDHHRPRFEP